MRNKLLHNSGIHIIEFITCGTYKIARYTILISAVDGEILLLPVHVRHVQNAPEHCYLHI